VSNPDATNPGTVGPFPPGTPVTGCNFGAGPGLTPGCFASYGLKRSFIGGGTAGYNWEFGKLVTGIEGEYGYLHLKGNGQLPFIGGTPCGSAANPCDVFFSTQAGNWFATITGRLGVTADTLNLQWLGGAHTLFYGKLGAAVSRVAVSEFSPGSAASTAVPFSFSGATNVWGLAAGLWIASGLARVFFGGRETSFYWRNGFFWVKLALFGLVFVLESTPMVTFIRVRSARRRRTAMPRFSVAAYRRINSAEIVLVVAIVFVAAFMARGAWLF